MTVEAKHLIEEFEGLPELSKREVLGEIPHISRHLDYPEVSDDELTSAANERMVEKAVCRWLELPCENAG